MNRHSQSPPRRRTHKDSAVEHWLMAILYNQSCTLHVLSRINERLDKIMAQLDTLETEVTEMEGTVDSAVALIQGLRDEIIAAGTDPAKLKALTDRLDAKTNALAAAVAAPGGGGSTGGV